MMTDADMSLWEAMRRSEETWTNRLRAMDRDLVLRVLDEVDAVQWGYSTVLDRAYRLDSCTYAVPGTADEQDAIAALLGLRALATGYYRYLDVDGWPPRLYVPMLFITSLNGRVLLDDLRGGEW